MLPISVRQIEFKHILWESIGETFDKYPKEMIIEFCDYWFEISHRGKKMRFEKEKTFGVVRRLATWKKHSSDWNKSPEKNDSFPNYFNKRLWQKLSIERSNEYRLHLKRLGWNYFSNNVGSYFRAPDNSITWL